MRCKCTNRLGCGVAVNLKVVPCQAHSEAQLLVHLEALLDHLAKPLEQDERVWLGHSHLTCSSSPSHPSPEPLQCVWHRLCFRRVLQVGEDDFLLSQSSWLICHQQVTQHLHRCQAFGAHQLLTLCLWHRLQHHHTCTALKPRPSWVFQLFAGKGFMMDPFHRGHLLVGGIPCLGFLDQQLPPLLARRCEV